MPQDSSTLDATPTQTLASVDPQISKLIHSEQERQEFTLEMIASENHTSPAVMEAVGSCLTNKYCEGYPGKRYYSGCAFYDEVEKLAIERACKLFGCQFANVQPHSGANANMATFFALLDIGDTFCSVELSDGGHLTHGSPVNISGKWYKPVHYPLVYDEARPDFGFIDYDAVEKLCMTHKPRLLICGYSAYPRKIDFNRFREIADKCGAILMADIAHIAGLVAGGSHESPFPHCHVVTTTTHKTLRGPRGGLVMTNDPEIAKKIDKAVFPGSQGGPLMHVIAGKAVCFGEALRDEFKAYAKQVVTNAASLAKGLQSRDWALASNGTDNHLMLMDLRRSKPANGEITGKDASGWLDNAGIITNKNTVARDERSPMVTSGVRIGTPALTTRGFKEDQMEDVADMIDRVLRSRGAENTIRKVRGEVVELCKQFPMPH
ncbi:MAG: aminotransferase class I/II-fold pyridoxal phosphate-dependent enzyme [Phycisphaera sp.]|nr:aminotransferase class I/II-fold pyridoxal phosphate-dependent enzyme [Phycisphaera sp.]